MTNTTINASLSAAAERYQLREVNAELLAALKSARDELSLALEALAKTTDGKDGIGFCLPRVKTCTGLLVDTLNACKAAIAKAEGK